MSPEIRAGDWLIGVISSPESRVYPGELVEVHNDGWLTAARVVGLDGDGRVEVDGGFFVVYGRPYSRTPSPVPRQYIAARLIAVWSPVRRSVVVLQ